MASFQLPYTLQSIAALPGHTDRTWNAAWNPVRSLVTTCSADKTVRVWAYDRDEKSGWRFKHVSTIETGHAKTVRALAWAPGGKTLATASFDANIGVWEQEGGDDEEGGGEWECASTLEGHETECKSVAYSANGNYLASCSRDKTVWIWEVLPDAEFETISVLMEHTQDVKCVAWHPTEEILASASYDDTIKLYTEDPSEDDWFCFATLTGHESTVWGLAWCPGTLDGRYLASSSADLSIRIWKRVEKYRFECVLVIPGLTDADSNVDANSNLKGHSRSVYSVSWGVGLGGENRETRNGKGKYLGWLASAGGDGSIMVWELEEPPEDASAEAVANAEPAPAPQPEPEASHAHSHDHSHPHEHGASCNHSHSHPKPTTTTTSSSSKHKLKYTLIAHHPSAHGVHDANCVVWCPRVGMEGVLVSVGDGVGAGAAGDEDDTEENAGGRVWRIVGRG